VGKDYVWPSHNHCFWKITNLEPKHSYLNSCSKITGMEFEQANLFSKHHHCPLENTCNVRLWRKYGFETRCHFWRVGFLIDFEFGYNEIHGPKEIAYKIGVVSSKLSLHLWQFESPWRDFVSIQLVVLHHTCPTQRWHIKSKERAKMGKIRNANFFT
jgi:hypothetical protein